MTVRSTGLLALAAATGLLLSACGSDAQNGIPPAGAAEGGGASAECFAGTLLASGSSAQDNAMQEWVSEFQGACPDATVNYQAVGSGAGIEAFLAGTTAFAGSDSALKEDEVAPAQERCGGTPAVNIPMVVGPVAIAYNLSGVEDLVLDAPTIAGIFSSAIASWDDPAIAALNPDVELPATPIRAVHRSDSSGTTDNVTSYLEAAAPDVWTFGSGKEWTAPGGEGAAKSSGVTQAVASSDGAVTYVEASFAENSDLTVARIDTGAETPVELAPQTAAAAVAAAEVVGEGQDLALDLDYATTAEGAYPIVLVTYEVTCLSGLPQAEADAVQAFLTYTASEEGQGILAGLGYAPLPRELAGRVQETVAAISASA